jgi:hypothetical protein
MTHNISVTFASGSKFAVPQLTIGSGIVLTQDLKGFRTAKNLDDAYMTAQLEIKGVPGSWDTYKKIHLSMTDYAGNSRIVFLGNAITFDGKVSPNGNGFSLPAADYEEYLSHRYLDDDHIVMLSTTQPDDFIEELLGTGNSWRYETGIKPIQILEVSDWGTSTLPARDFTDWTNQTTYWEAIQDICEYCHFIFFVLPLYDAITGEYYAGGYFVPEADIDDYVRAMVTFTKTGDKYLVEPVRVLRKGDSRFNRVKIGGQDSFGVDPTTPFTYFWHTNETAAVTAHEEIPRERKPEVNKYLLTQAEVNAYCDAVWQYVSGFVTTYSATFSHRPDLQRLQKIKIVGYTNVPEDEMRIIGIEHEGGLNINRTHVKFVKDAVFTLMVTIGRMKRPDNIDEAQQMMEKLIERRRLLPEVGIVDDVDPTTKKVRVITEEGRTTITRNIPS